MSDEPEINVENCRVLLTSFMERQNVATPSLAKAIGCGHATIGRILTGITLPSDEFIRQTGILFEVGFDNYRKLSSLQKEQISQKI